MCLKTITAEITLDYDLEVLKIVKRGNDNHYYFGNMLISNRLLRINRIKKGLNKANCKYDLFTDDFKHYKSGYHCFDVNSNLNTLKFYMFSGEVIKQFIIPKGTKIIVGKQFDLLSYVTPFLLNK